MNSSEVDKEVDNLFSKFILDLKNYNAFKEIDIPIRNIIKEAFLKGLTSKSL